MADSKSYQKFPEVTIFFGQACENETKATDALADALNLAEVTADKWPEDILGAWTSGLKPLMESIQPNSTHTALSIPKAAKAPITIYPAIKSTSLYCMTEP
jgi:hypothetical protein